ncbi:HAD-IA family hydrolase [Coralliovum pocilloporae]|uniref:HAD-IA family hydrolase n=1 Tax=Coralliovum pocilloporae TaxID=3066369 RepID=UPI0033070C14
MYLVIFDCDGTLVDSQVMIVSAMNEAFRSLGVQEPTRAQTLSIVGLSLEPAMQRLMPEGAEVSTSELATAYKDAFIRMRREHQALEPFYDGMKEMVLELSAREDILLGIATGKARRGVDHVLKGHDLEGRFVTIQTADIAPSKPHPGMVLQAMAETGAVPERTVMIGDTSFDMAMGRAAGSHTMGVSWGYHSTEEMLEAGAHHVMDTPEALMAALNTFAS